MQREPGKLQALACTAVVASGSPPQGCACAQLYPTRVTADNAFVSAETVALPVCPALGRRHTSRHAPLASRHGRREGPVGFAIWRQQLTEP